MLRRKIQLIAGSTYSVSLPKEWVLKNNLKKGNEINFYEKNEGNLLISASSITKKETNEIALNIDEYISSIDQIVFALYYLGIENINLFSKRGMARDIEMRIRNTVRHMSGTEITHEDENNIHIRVLLDKLKVNILQILYRISLIIGSSITLFIGELDIKEIKINENEIDRLYHLVTKIISLSLIDPNILKSSQIKNVSLVPSFLLISKKLENIADFIEDLADYTNQNKIQVSKITEVLNFAKIMIKRNILHIMGKQIKIFEKIPVDKIKPINQIISSIKDKSVQAYLEDIIRYIIDIEEEIINISFYNKLIADGVV